MNEPIYTYQLLVLRNQLTPLEVKATCAEEACQTIKRCFFGLKEAGLVEFNGHDLHDTWLVMRTTPFEYCNFLHIEMWDGQHFKSFGRAEPGQDIVSATRKLMPLDVPQAANSNEGARVYAAA